jgi:hypothetical protein
MSAQGPSAVWLTRKSRPLQVGDVLIAVLLFSLFWGEGRAIAHESTWRIIGAGCIPEDRAIQKDLYQTLGHGIKFKPSKHGILRLICPITFHRTKQLDFFDMFYKDGDGQGTDFEIEANFRSARQGSPISRIVCSTTSHNKTSNNFTSVRCNFANAGMLIKNNYWFEIKIIKSADAPGNDHEFLGILLD